MKALQPQDASRIQLEHAAHLSEIGKVSIVLLKYMIPFRMGDHRIITAQDTVLKEVSDIVCPAVTDDGLEKAFDQLGLL